MDTMIQSIIRRIQEIETDLVAAQAPPSTQVPRPASQIPIEFALAVRPDWTEEKARALSHIYTYRESDGPGKFTYNFELIDSPKIFWTGVQLKYNRNVPAKFRLAIVFTDELDYTLTEWIHTSHGVWTPFPCIIPALYTTNYKLIIQVEIPALNVYKEPIYVTMNMAGFENMIERYPRLDMCDSNGNRVLTWMPTDRAKNKARLYHVLADGEPPFEPNVEILPSPEPAAAAAAAQPARV
jgi:hypothetical protein